MSKNFKFLILLFIALFSVIPSSYASVKMTRAPVSEKFTEWQKNNKNDKNKKNSSMIHSKGLKPSPRDFSHLKNNLPKNSSSRKVKSSSYPETYDLRDYGAVPSVRDQNPYGTCWAHATLGSLESSYMKQNLSSSEPDLSELHLAWFIYKDPTASNNYTVTGYYGVLNEGGNVWISSAYLTRLSGAVNESSMPYENAGTDSNMKKYVGDNDPSAYFPIAMTVKERIDIGEIDSSNRDLIKQMLIDYGAVQISYYAGEGSTSSEGSTTAYFDNSAYEYTNHAVLIVGWDDNFSRNNFGSTKPSKNGAWLVRNSWGSDWGDDGYFYMSYEQYIDNAAVFVAEKYDSSEKLYYYDALGDVDSFGFQNDKGKYTKSGYSANVFQADNDENIKSVGFFTTDNNVDFEIYLVKFGTSKPDEMTFDDKELLTSGTAPYAGYHKVDVSGSVKAGNYFAVAVKVTNPSYGCPIATETAYEDYSDYAEVNSGESYFSSNGDGWSDGSEVGANACIKVFTSLSSSSYESMTLSSTLPNGVRKKSYNGVIELTGGKAPYTWKQSGTLPAGLNFSGSETKATISGKPTKSGEFTFTVTVTDSTGASVSIRPTITITQTTINGTFKATGYVNKEYSSAIKAEKGTKPYTWTLSSGTLPDGLELVQNSSGTKIYLKGTPTKAKTYKFKLKVTDKGKISATKTFTVTISAPSITGTFKNGVKNQNYSSCVKVCGGVKPYTWTKTSGTLPKGLELVPNSNGTKIYLKGTPKKAKTYNFKLKASDKNGASKTVKFTVNISASSSAASKSLNPKYENAVLESGFNTEINILTPLKVSEDDILWKGEGKDEDLIGVKAGEPLTFSIGEWPNESEILKVVVLIDDEPDENISVSDEGEFIIPSEFVDHDFKVKAEAETKTDTLETEEIFISVE